MANCPPLPTDRIKAGWSTYELSEMRPDRSRRDETFAVVDHSALTLEVVLDLGHPQAAKSLLHELLHIVERLWVVKDGDDDERRVSAISHGLSTLWRDNPELMEWIGKGLTDG